MLTVGDIKAAIRAHGFETDLAAQQLIFINETQRDVIGDHRWRFMLTSATVAAVAGTASYTLPTSPALHHVESIRLAITGTFLPELEWRDTEDFLAEEAANASFVPYTTPYWWTDAVPGSFRVYPAPSSAGTFTVRYFKQLTDLTADGDTPQVPTPYLDVIVAGACAKLAGRERRFDAADRWQKRYEERLAAMRSQYGLRQRQNSDRVLSSGRYGDRERC